MITWKWEREWEPDKSESHFNGSMGYLTDSNDDTVLWFGMDGAEGIYCPNKEQAALIAAAPETKARYGILLAAMGEISAKIEGNPEQPMSVAELVEACTDELAELNIAAAEVK